VTADSLVEEARFVFRSLAGLALLLGLGLWALAYVYWRRRRPRDLAVVLVGGMLALIGGAYVLWSLR
jgi:hypothetical protein